MHISLQDPSLPIFLPCGMKHSLAQPGVEFFEVDLPAASERKQNLVAKLRMITPEVKKLSWRTSVVWDGHDGDPCFCFHGLFMILPRSQSIPVSTSLSHPEPQADVRCC